MNRNFKRTFRLWSVFFIACAAQPAAAQFCPYNPGGSPTCGEDTASQGSTASTAAGNPIDVTTGNKYQRETDVEYPGELAIGFTRHYNSLSDAGTTLGRGWTHGFETTIVRAQDPSGTVITIRQADGRQVEFRPSESAAVGTTEYRAPATSLGAIEEDSSAISTLRRLIEGAASAAGPRDRSDVRPWVWRWPDGRTLSFDGRGKLREVSVRSGAKIVADYDSAGRLTALRDDAGRVLTLRYWDDARERLAKFEDKTSSAISGYRGRLKSVEGPDGGKVLYGYDEHGTLTSVIRADGRLRRYEYQGVRGKSRLTKIFDGDEVAGEYRYDAAGRANYSAARGEAVSIRFSDTSTKAGSGESLVTPRNGAPTLYRWRVSAATGERQIVESRGPGCTLCPPGNRRYTFDAHGALTLTEYLAPPGAAASPKAIRASLYKSGRDDGWAVVSAEVLIHDSVGRLTERRLRDAAGRERLGERLEYADAAGTRPSLVERPSIVAGQFHSIRMRYDALGLLVGATETGFAPELRESPGFKAMQATKLERATQLQYERKGARWVVRSIDGPLPGTADTVYFDWDAHGVNLLRTRYPLGLKHEWAFDPRSGRLASEIPIDGVPISYEYDARGAIRARHRADASWTIGKDERGRTNRLSTPDGEILSVAYDGPGASIALLSNRGTARWLKPPAIEAAVASSEAAVLPVTNEVTPEIAHDWGPTLAVLDDFGRLIASSTLATGQERYEYDATDRVTARGFANGVRWEYQRDVLGRVVEHRVRDARAAMQVTKLTYEGAGVARVDAARESVIVERDGRGRVVARTVSRQLDGTTSHAFTERFEYDSADRLIAHHLPEGGTLEYRWGTGTTLEHLAYRDDFDSVTTLIDGAPSGYRYGNGVTYSGTLGKDGRLQHFEYRAPAIVEARNWSLIPTAMAANASTPLLDVSLTFDPQGKVATRTENGVTTGYGFDRRGRLLVAASEGHEQFYAYNGGGDLLARRISGTTLKFDPRAIVRDPSGLPARASSMRGDRELSYSADRRLSEVRDGRRVIARYTHNTHGERIAKRVFAADGAAATTEYYYFDRQLVGESRAGHPGLISRRYVYANGVPVAVLDYPAARELDRQIEAGDTPTRGVTWAQTRLHGAWQAMRGEEPRITYLQTNEIGTPVLGTDSNARVVWRPEYLAYGAIRGYVETPDFELNLRLPGQYYDAETGWHDNYLRTYDPARGQYLEPDPLGSLPNLQTGRRLTQPFAYADHDPVLHADPLGLLLIPFDGTANNKNDLTNVYWFGYFYDSLTAFDRERNYSGLSFYVEGVNTGDEMLDNAFYGGALAVELRERVNRGLGFVDQYLRDYYSWESLRRLRDGLPPISASNPLKVDLDTVGFSRGAATSREFINMVLDRIESGYYNDLTGGCVSINLRMMALFETVLSHNSGEWGTGQPFRMVVPDEVQYAAQAVAVNEHRRSFSLEMLNPSPASIRVPGDFQANRIERGFIGAHSDIGGGYNGNSTHAESYDGGDLSDVALNWMMEQAKIAGLSMKPLPIDLRVVSRPIVHDERRGFTYTATFQRWSDRDVRFRGTTDRNNVDGMSWTPMREIVLPGGMSTAVSEPMVDWFDLNWFWDGRQTQVGLVRTCDYMRWLNENYGMHWRSTECN